VHQKAFVSRALPRLAAEKTRNSEQTQSKGQKRKKGNAQGQDRKKENGQERRDKIPYRYFIFPLPNHTPF